MSKKSFLISILILIFSSNLAADKIKISPPQYYIGGIFGTLPGLGIGHVIQQRYSKTGWIFTLGEVGSLLAASIGAIILGAHSANPFKLFMSVRYPSGVIPLLWTAGLVFLGFKTWEIVDIWTGAEPDFGTPSNKNSYLKDINKPVGLENGKNSSVFIFDVINIPF